MSKEDGCEMDCPLCSKRCESEKYIDGIKFHQHEERVKKVRYGTMTRAYIMHQWTEDK